MKKIIPFILAILLVIEATAACSAQTQESQPLRLHVIANSNTREDQAVKLKVRDDLLVQTGEAIEGMQNKQQAEQFISSHLQEITENANRVLSQNGFNYKASVTVGESYFPEKQYGETVYPAGNYQALKIVLGEGKGDNWWCVIFPPLCIIAMNESFDAYTDYGINKKEKGKIKFKSIFEGLF